MAIIPTILSGLIFLSVLHTGCRNASGEEANALATEKSVQSDQEDTCTYIDLNTGDRVKLKINPNNDITTNAETGEIVRIYVNPATKDTFDGLNGRKVNHAIIRTSLGTFGIDMTKVKLDEKVAPVRKEELAGNDLKK